MLKMACAKIGLDERFILLSKLFPLASFFSQSHKQTTLVSQNMLNKVLPCSHRQVLTRFPGVPRIAGTAKNPADNLIDLAYGWK